MSLCDYHLFQYEKRQKYYPVDIRGFDVLYNSQISLMVINISHNPATSIYLDDGSRI
jgi:hypothetical protein